MPGHDSKEIEDLSALLGKLATKLGLSGDAKYRNRNGVYMKLMNFRALDPECVSASNFDPFHKCN
jgi:5-methylcytosine-specific restriction protein A